MNLVVVDRPAGHVELVRSLVVEITVSGLPEPVPVVVHQVRVIVVDHGRPLPEVPVERYRGSRVGHEADRFPRLAAVPVGEREPRQGAVLQGLVEPRDVRIAASLRAMLHHHSILRRRGDGDPAFGDVVAEGLLDVDVLAGLGSKDRHQRVPMVGGGDRDGIDALVVEHSAKVGQCRRRGGCLAGLLPEHFEGAAEHLRVGIDDGRDLDVVEAHETAQVGLAAAVEAEHGDTDTIVRTPHRGLSAWRREQQRSSGCRRGEKPPAGSGVLHPSISLWEAAIPRIIRKTGTAA